MYRVLVTLLGALGFLSRFPVGRDDRAWAAFRDTPAAFPVAGYAVGALVALPVFLALALGTPTPTAAFVLVLGIYLVTGINHADGIADVGDAAVVHGGPKERRTVMRDTTVGVGAVLALGVVLVGLALAGLGLAALAGSDPTLPTLVRVAGLVVAAEVGAKLGMAAVVCFGTAAHDGLGSALTERSGPRAFVFPALLSLPTIVLTWPQPAAAVALVAGVAAALAVLRWARAVLGGASGDVLGATNEIVRVTALHAGVIAWTLS